MIFIAAKADPVDPLLAASCGFLLWHTLNSQPVTDIAHDRVMRQKCEPLENHRCRVSPEFRELCFTHFKHILTVYNNLTRSRLDEPVDMANQRRFTRPGQAHNDLDASRRDIDIDVVECQYSAVFFQQLHFGNTALDMVDHTARILPKNLVKIFDGHFCFRHHGRSPGVSVAVSRMIAISCQI